MTKTDRESKNQARRMRLAFRSYKAVSGRFLFAVVYASGERGKSKRGDGNGGYLLRGFYYRRELPSGELTRPIGPYATQRQAACAARTALSLIPDSLADQYR